jgi:hypothetical protein
MKNCLVSQLYSVSLPDFVPAASAGSEPDRPADAIVDGFRTFARK